MDTILAKTYSVDEFISQRKEIEIFEVTDAMLRNNYTAFICIGDIIDAIYLRSIVGDEVVDMIEDCYMNNILGSKTFLNDVNLEEKKSYGK